MSIKLVTFSGLARLLGLQSLASLFSLVLIYIMASARSMSSSMEQGEVGS